MKNLNSFLKRSEIQLQNIKCVVCEDITDERGKPVEWELKKLTAKEGNIAQDEAVNLNIKTQDASFDQSLFREKVVAMSVVYPNLNNKELQDAFGARTPEDLLQSMLSMSEYMALEQKVNELNGNVKILEEVKEEAKN